MDKMEILQHVVNVHNRMAGIMVSGDNAIMMADSLKELRYLASGLQKDVELKEVNKQQEEMEE